MVAQRAVGLPVRGLALLNAVRPLTIDAQVYRFDANGCAKTRWVLSTGDSWYHSSTGAQQSGWLTLGAVTYYLDQQPVRWPPAGSLNGGA